MDFLDADNPAGQTLLILVARGSAIIAELLRLSAHIPSVFQGSPLDPHEQAKYASIVLDFRYLKNPEGYDEVIDRDVDKVDLDETFRETHSDLLERFYKLFESVFKYVQDLNGFIEELTQGTFVAHTIDGVLLDIEGKQLMTEALYLYGVMLLLLDMRLPGHTRERLIVSHYRYKGSNLVTNFKEVCSLCRCTTTSGKKPPNYPEEYFSRLTIPQMVTEMMISRLRSDDLYHHTAAFPSPSHRSTALATQAGMLYVILFFAPRLLHKETNIMREIVDKNFSDNWVVPFYMGFHTDLEESWAAFKAAATAIKPVLKKETVMELCQKHVVSLKSTLGVLENYLTEGILHEEFVLDNTRPLFECAREANVLLRFFLLHRTCINPKLREIVLKSVPDEPLMLLMTHAAQFEFILKTLFKQLLDVKQDRWDACQKEAVDRMNELSVYFSGEAALTRVTKNTNLVDWFKKLAEEIAKLSTSNALVAGRRIAQLIQSLKDVEQFDEMYNSLQVKSFLHDTRDHLLKMIRAVNIKEKFLTDLDIISDYSYAFILLNEYTPQLHVKLKTNPTIVLRLRATFLKLSSILSLPLVRITQANSPDDVSVAQFFSSELVAYVRRVLQVIPKSVFETLDEIIHLQTHQLNVLPMKIERKSIADHAQLSERYQLSKATHQVSVYTSGILCMEETLLGIIQLDPKEILAAGVRKELVWQISNALNQILVFKEGTIKDFEMRVNALNKKLDGFRQSFEYIQDYISMYGLKIWQEEFSRIIAYYVEQESNTFLKKKIYDWQSGFQSDAIPIPASFPGRDPKDASVNFMGRLARELLSQTNPVHTIYVDSRQGWYLCEKGKNPLEVVGIRTFSLLHKGVGIFGLTGLDKLLCFMIVKKLTDFTRIYRKTMVQSTRDFFVSMTNLLTPTSHFPADAARLYTAAQQRTAKLWPVFSQYMVLIGQCQLLRCQIANELNFSAKMDSHILSNALGVLNDTLMNDVLAHYARPDTNPYPGNPVLPELSRYLETIGLNSPITQIYITTTPLDTLPLVMFLFVLDTVGQLRYDPSLYTLVNTDRKSKQPLDGAPFIVGVTTMLKQCHSSHTHTFLAYLGQYVRAEVGNQDSKTLEIPLLVRNVLLFLEEFVRFSRISRAVVDAVVPSYLFDRFRHG